MNIITFANQKGGVGKTTFTINFACIAASKGNKTLVIDTDNQESSMKFRELRPENAPQFQAVSIKTPTIHKDINQFSADMILIDSGGRDSKVFRSSLMATNSIIVPLVPSQLDFWSTEETFSLIEEVRQINDKIKVGVVINQVIAGTTISKDIIKTMDEYVNKYSLHLFKTLIYSRIAFKEAVSEGKGVIEMSQSKYKQAKNEMINFYEEVMEWL